MSILRKLYQPYKYLIYVPGLALATATLCSLTAIVAYIHPMFSSRYCASLWARTIFRIAPAHVKVIGRENIQKGQGYMIVANHKSLFDIPVLYGWIKLPTKWVMKKELKKVPFVGWACRVMNHVFIDRGNMKASAEALEHLKDDYKPGMSVVFFPEGTRSDDGAIQKFRRGAFVTAKDLDLPILPVTIVGTHKILPSGSMDLFPGTAKLVIHEPIPVEQVREMKVLELTNLAHSRVASALEE